jgi:hypothetical protein
MTLPTWCSEQDQNALLSGSKIEPLKSPIKYHHCDHDDHGVIGEDFYIQETHEEPLRSELKRESCFSAASHHVSRALYSHFWAVSSSLLMLYQDHHIQAPHADSQGVVGREDIIQSAKIEPMKKEMFERTEHTHGLDDETVDAARIPPMGEVRDNFLGESPGHR